MLPILIQRYGKKSFYFKNDRLTEFLQAVREPYFMIILIPYVNLLNLSLRKHAYSNILKTLPPKNENLQIKKADIFSYFCSKHGLWYSLEPPRRGGSNEYPQSMFLIRNKKNNVYPCKPQFYNIKVGFEGVKII